MKHRTFFYNTMSITLGCSGSKLRAFGLTLLLMVMAFGLNASKAQAQTYAQKTFHSFSGGNDGSYSRSNLVDVNGVLYGTTVGGGSQGAGTVFSVNPDGTGYQTLYSFQATSSTDGYLPYGGLLLVNGKLYGITNYGGTKNDGTIFSFDPATSTEKILYSFQANSTTDGASPIGNLTDVNGLLYGTTINGGASNYGTIYSFDPISLTETTIHSFTKSSGDGANPFSGVIAVSNVLYGTTEYGGNLGYGIVYSLDLSSGTEHILHTFTGTANNQDGSNPSGGLVLLNNVLYGTTFYGGNSNDGTIFSFKTDGSRYQVLYDFTGMLGDGAAPYAGLIAVNGLLYGTTQQGGIDSKGTIFALDPTSGNETVLYDFSDTDGSGYNSDGANPIAGLLSINGTFYGAAYYGGTSGKGTIFSLTPVTVPVAKNDAGRGIANHTIIVGAPGVLGNDNLGGDPNTSAAVITNPTHGTLTFNSNGSFQYTPSKNYVGSDSFTYKDTNAVGTSNTATCSLTIGPIAYDDQGRTYFNTPVTINAPGVLANDVTGGLTTTASLVTNPSHGTIAFNSNGGFTYTPNSGFLGTDSFTYKITDAGGTSAPATCTMTVQARTPVANNDSGRVTHNTTLTITAPGVLGNDNPGSTGTVTAAIVTNPTHGTITFNSNGSFVYKPTTGFIGTDSFTYKDTNSVGTSNTATCTLTVQ